jgi:hypothetical protein
VTKGSKRYFSLRRSHDDALAWLALLNDPDSADQHSIAHVDRLMDAGKHEPGTAWDELRIAYRNWRRVGR